MIKSPAMLNYSLLEIEFNIWAYQPSVLSHLVKDKHIYYSTFIMVIYCIVLWPNFMARTLNIYDTFFFLVSIVTLHVRYVFFFGGDFFCTSLVKSSLCAILDVSLKNEIFSLTFKAFMEYGLTLFVWRLSLNTVF